MDMKVFWVFLKRLRYCRYPRAMKISFEALQKTCVFTKFGGWCSKNKPATPVWLRRSWKKFQSKVKSFQRVAKSKNGFTETVGDIVVFWTKREEEEEEEEVFLSFVICHHPLKCFWTRNYISKMYTWTSSLFTMQCLNKEKNFHALS